MSQTQWVQLPLMVLISHDVHLWEKVEMSISYIVNRESHGNVMVNQLNDKLNRRKFSPLWNSKGNMGWSKDNILKF